MTVDADIRDFEREKKGRKDVLCSYTMITLDATIGSLFSMREKSSGRESRTFGIAHGLYPLDVLQERCHVSPFHSWTGGDEEVAFGGEGHSNGVSEV